MQPEQILTDVKALIRENPVFALATASAEGEPHVRYMGATILEEPFTLYLATGPSRKTADAAANARAELLFTSKDWARRANLEGEVEILRSGPKRRELWDAFLPEIASYFSGPDDENYLVFAVRVREIHYYAQQEQPQPHRLSL